MVISCRQRVIDEQGVTYLWLMFVIVLIGITTTATAKQWKAIVQREREEDLLAKGIEIQNALALYSATIKAGRVMPGEVYPQTLADLTRLPKPFLRKVYRDPMGQGEWEYLLAPTGGIMGVRSKSLMQPFRQRNFPSAVRHFEGRATYRD
ncbi:MAG: type II secretion system protein [Nitrospirota bacterium]